MASKHMHSFASGQRVSPGTLTWLAVCRCRWRGPEQLRDLARSTLCQYELDEHWKSEHCPRALPNVGPARIQ